MNRVWFGRLARSLAVVGIVTSIGVGLGAPREAGLTPVALAGVAQNNGNDNNDDRTNDNSEERILRGQVIELWRDLNPPEMLVATLEENVWARVYGDQIQRSGVNVGDHVRLQGEYNRGIFDTYEIDVTTRCCPRPNDNGDNRNDND
jgi:hypothetical protein